MLSGSSSGGVSSTEFDLGSILQPGVESIPTANLTKTLKLYPGHTYRSLVICVFLGTIPWLISAISLAVLVFPRQDINCSQMLVAIILFGYTISILYLQISVPWRVLGWLAWSKKEHKTLIIFVLATLGLMIFWGIPLSSPFFLGLFKQSRFFAGMLVLSETMSAICLILLAVFWWEKRKESVKLILVQKASDIRKKLSTALSAKDGLDRRSSSISSRSCPEIDVERLAGPREIDFPENANPFVDPSNEDSPHNLDLSLPESDIVEETSQTIIEHSTRRSSSIMDNPFSPNISLSHPTARGSIQSEDLSEIVEYEILQREETSCNEAVEPLTPQNDDGQETAAGMLIRHDTFESIATYSTLPSYHSRDSRAVIESVPPQMPSLPLFRPLPSIYHIDYMIS